MKRDPVKKLKFGALPFRDISETPYITHALMLAEDKWPKLDANAGGVDVNCGESSKSVPTAMPYLSKERVLELMSEVVSKHENLWRIAHEKHVSRLVAELRSVVSSCFPESGQCSNQPPDIVQGLVARDNVAKDVETVFPQGIHGSARTSNVDKDAAMPCAKGVQSSPSRVVVDEVGTPQQVQNNQSGPSSVSVINIASTTVTKVAPHEVEGEDRLGVGIDIAMSYANEEGLPPEDTLKLLSGDTLTYASEDDHSPEDALKLLPEDRNILSNETTGVTTIDKRNRKKRAVKVLSPEKKVSKLELDEKVKEFYSKYLRNIFFKAKDSPVVVDVNNYTVKYDKFYSSCKAIGEIDDECMNAYAQVFNSENSEAVPDQRKCTKYCLTSYFTSKLLVDPEKFSFGSCKKELSRIAKEVNLMKCDMLYFPNVDDHHWTLFCVNNLYNQVNFFDSASVVTEDERKLQINNLKVHFSRLCKVVEPKMKDIASFSEIIPSGYPQQMTLHDCGFFVILYMLYWDGRALRDFDTAILPDFREMAAYTLAKSTLNKIDLDDNGANEKKRKRK